MENVLSVDLPGHQSHAELLIYIQKKQANAPIRQLNCNIFIPHEEFNMQHPLYAYILCMTTLEQVGLRSFVGSASIDVFLDAVLLNDSIHTVQLFQIDCSANVIQKLME